MAKNYFYNRCKQRKREWFFRRQPRFCRSLCHSEKQQTKTRSHLSRRIIDKTRHFHTKEYRNDNELRTEWGKKAQQLNHVIWEIVIMENHDEIKIHVAYISAVSKSFKLVKRNTLLRVQLAMHQNLAPTIWSSRSVTVNSDASKKCVIFVCPGMLMQSTDGCTISLVFVAEKIGDSITNTIRTKSPETSAHQLSCFFRSGWV